MSAAMVAGALCLEPFALTAAGRSYRGTKAVRILEIAGGMGLAAHFLIEGTAHRRRGQSPGSCPTAA